MTRPLEAQPTPEPDAAIGQQQFSDEVTVTGRGDSLIGISGSASEGTIGTRELRSRPLLRSSDIMEVVPGVAMTQHSTGGHAPIILLRGYNLDHGTDFATSVEGAPLNLPSHAHAQGYTDLNFLITEMIGRVDFQKGPYAARVGNFGTAGAASIEPPDTIERSFLAFETGPYDYYRGIGAGSISRGDRHVLYAAEANHYNGPSVVPDAFKRVRGMLRYSRGSGANGPSVSFYGYGARWTATDGYPQRVLERGYISRFGTLDGSDGGGTQRHLVVANWRRGAGRTLARTTAYAQYYDFNLYSNLTFWTVDPIVGDQIGQTERRFTGGGASSRKHFTSWRGRSVELTAGADLRYDRVALRLTNTVRRVPTSKTDDSGRRLPAVVYDNRIDEINGGPFAEARVQWSSWFRTVAGVRGDILHMQVDSRRVENSGRRSSAIATPKAGAILGPWAQTEFYANAGYGFHSNHANGVMQQVDAITGLTTRSDGTSVVASEPLVRTRGAELGLRSLALAGLQTSLAWWLIDSDSELIYTPEDGFTQPERPGRRYGLEWNNFYRPLPWLTGDLDIAWSRARYRIDPFGQGRYISDAISAVVTAGVATSHRRFGSSLRLRYLGRRPLTADGSVFSNPATLVNGQLEFRLNERLSVGLDGFNLLNREYEDIAYYFSTRVRDPRGGQLESSAQPDFVTHPGEPRTARLRLRARF